MKLTRKLSLAFLFVSLVAIGLAALFVWTTTSTTFNAYLLDQRQAEFIAAATQHYQTYGSWENVNLTLREQGFLPPPSPLGLPPNNQQPFALINQKHMVIIPSGKHQLGQKIPPEVLAHGAQITVDGLVVGTTLTTGQPPARSPIEDKYLESVNRSLLIAALGGSAIALILGLLIARSLTRPIRDLKTATRALALGQLEKPVPIRTADELGELAASFNQMSADLMRANQSRKQMTADIAHDLRNPLTVIGGYLESLKDGKLQPTPERFAVMQSEVQHLQRLVEELRTLSLADAGELKLHPQPVQARALLEQVAAVYRHQAETQGIKIRVHAAPALSEIFLDAERMKQALGNLIGNALRYTPAGGEIYLNAEQAERSLIISVRDTGSGISPDILPHIFERSYRGDASRSGSQSGLGLAITKSIIELHGGSIHVESDGTGSHFFIVFPL